MKRKTKAKDKKTRRGNRSAQPAPPIPNRLIQCALLKNPVIILRQTQLWNQAPISVAIKLPQRPCTTPHVTTELSPTPIRGASAISDFGRGPRVRGLVWVLPCLKHIGASLTRLGAGAHRRIWSRIFVAETSAFSGAAGGFDPEVDRRRGSEEREGFKVSR